MVPIKIIIKGDFVTGRGMVGFAKDQMRILETSMSFQKLKQGSRTVKPFRNIVVECWSSFSLQVITIHVTPPPPSVKGYGHKEPLKRKCHCFPCFSFGIIDKIRTVPTDEEYYGGVRFEYDISICQGESFFILENYEVKAAGWEEYYEKQFVMVTIDVEDIDDTPPDCCIKKNCFVTDFEDEEKLVPECFQIAPLFVTGEMTQWQTSLI